MMQQFDPMTAQLLQRALSSQQGSTPSPLAGALGGAASSWAPSQQGPVAPPQPGQGVTTPTPAPGAGYPPNPQLLQGMMGTQAANMAQPQVGQSQLGMGSLANGLGALASKGIQY